MRIVCLRHVSFEGPACIAEWARGRGHRLSVTDLWRGEPLPSIEDMEWLMVMGGPMSANDESRHAWLRDEKRMLAAAMEAGKVVLGICLGAQLIADVLGARVYPNKQKEIGWFPVSKTPSAGLWGPATALPDRCRAFHWHGETFDMPVGAVHWLSSEGCVNQAFAYADRVVGIQCHLEVTPESARALVDQCGSDREAGPFVQTPAEMLRSETLFKTANATMCTLLDEIERIAGERSPTNA